jgi:hypothetical protein
MKTTLDKREFAGIIFPAALFLTFFFAQPAYGNSDSTKTKNKKEGTEYPLDDPRNPNCPCHVYQKIADAEWKKIHTESQKSQKGSSSGISNTTNADHVKKSSYSGSGIIYGKRKHRNTSRFFFKVNRKFLRIFHAKKKVKSSHSVCYRWGQNSLNF